MSATLSKQEIRARAARFAEDYKDARREEAEAQSFQKDFFERVLGISAREVSIFEYKVQCRDGSNGYIDLFWKGHILIEMKSLGEDRSKAFAQAKRYAESLKRHEMPRAILICDFQHWDFYDLDNGAQLTSFTLDKLPEFIDLFFFLAGYEKHGPISENPVNVQAAELMGLLHDSLRDIGYTGHPLEVYLVRLLFCLFAEDTDIFERNSFYDFIINCTAEDGNDLAPRLAELFQVLNTPLESRLRTRNEDLLAFPYVNGKLFAEYLPMPAFDARMRGILLECCRLDWGKISPAIFGSMFQSVMLPAERRALGAHYTSERNILKLINPLFMDALRTEFETIRADRSSRRRARLAEFHTKLSRLTFLDPACGCGNFLVVAYRELRLLEMEVIRELDDGEASLMENLSLLNVDQFYGIEIEEFPAHIAQVAMWLMDHQMNVQLGRHFGKSYVRIPLRHSAAITCGNALRIDWESIVPREKLNFILGNPPFVGKSYQSKEQKEDMAQVFVGVRGYGNLDFVACWFKKAADYMCGTSIESAFVATNSLCQGIAVPPLWERLYSKGIVINFAYHSFKWDNEAKGKAGVHCIIVGFGYVGRREKIIFNGDSCKIVTNINSYLLEGPSLIITDRDSAVSNVPPISVGSFAVDGGNLIMNREEVCAILAEDNSLKAMIRPYLSPEDFLNGKSRYCFWLKGISPMVLKKSPIIRERLKAVQRFRSTSKKIPTQRKAATPWLFGEDRQPDSNYILIPRTSSENRLYIPMGFVSAEVIAGDTIILPNATLYHFGVLTSTMHMAWMRTVCGRLEMRYRYSSKIVYNNFPWPEATVEQQEKIVELAQGVLEARALYPESSLAALYDPLTMPPELVCAHKKLDAAVERAYGHRFTTDAERVAFLFERYKQLTAAEYDDNIKSYEIKR